MGGESQQRIKGIRSGQKEGDLDRARGEGREETPISKGVTGHPLGCERLVSRQEWGEDVKSMKSIWPCLIPTSLGKDAGNRGSPANDYEGSPPCVI